MTNATVERLILEDIVNMNTTDMCYMNKLETLVKTLFSEVKQ